MIIKTDRLIPRRHHAITIGPIILVRPQYAHDEGLIAHEKVHVRQWKKCPIGFPLRYLLSSEARLHYELEAYAEQHRHYKDDRAAQFAYLIAHNYRINIPESLALELLADAIKRRT